MKINEENVTEHDDGSATFEVDMTSEEIALLVNYAMDQLLRSGLESGTIKPIAPNDEENENV